MLRDVRQPRLILVMVQDKSDRGRDALMVFWVKVSSLLIHELTLAPETNIAHPKFAVSCDEQGPVAGRGENH